MKIKDFVKLGSGIAGAFVPGAGPILAIINKSIGDDDDTGNVAALKQIGENLEEVAQVLRDHEKRLRKLGGK